jgi:hypothetical protein
MNFGVRQLNELQFDYEVMSTLTGNTAGSLKKMWPPVKKKALETCPSFAKFLSTDGGNIAAPKATGGRKRKAAADADVEDTETKDADPKSAGDKSDSANKSEGKAETKKKAPMAKGKGRPAKKTKKEEVKAEEDSADGGDGLGEYTHKQEIMKWLNSTDGSLDKEKDVDEEA